jgi:hypothetical protein
VFVPFATSATPAGEQTLCACRIIEAVSLLALMRALQRGAVFVSHRKYDVRVAHQQISKVPTLLYSSSVRLVVAVWAI